MLWLTEPLVPVRVRVYVPAGVPLGFTPPPPPPPEPPPLPPPHPLNPNASSESPITNENLRALGEAFRCDEHTKIPKTEKAIMEYDHQKLRLFGFPFVTPANRTREVVATETVPTPSRVVLSKVYAAGSAVQVVPVAGTEHETVTDPEKPKNDVTARSLM
jgi:hypothetical protein